MDTSVQDRATRVVHLTNQDGRPGIPAVVRDLHAQRLPRHRRVQRVSIPALPGQPDRTGKDQGAGRLRDRGTQRRLVRARDRQLTRDIHLQQGPPLAPEPHAGARVRDSSLPDTERIRPTGRDTLGLRRLRQGDGHPLNVQVRQRAGIFRDLDAGQRRDGRLRRRRGRGAARVRRPRESSLVPDSPLPHLPTVVVRHSGGRPGVVPGGRELHRRLRVVAAEVLREQAQTEEHVVLRVGEVQALVAGVPVERPVCDLRGADAVRSAARPGAIRVQQLGQEGPVVRVRDRLVVGRRRVRVRPVDAAPVVAVDVLAGRLLTDQRRRQMQRHAGPLSGPHQCVRVEQHQVRGHVALAGKDLRGSQNRLRLRLGRRSRGGAGSRRRGTHIPGRARHTHHTRGQGHGTDLTRPGRVIARAPRVLVQNPPTPIRELRQEDQDVPVVPAPVQGNHVAGPHILDRNVAPVVRLNVVPGQECAVPQNARVPVNRRPVMQNRVHTLRPVCTIEVDVLPVDRVRPRLDLSLNLRQQHGHGRSSYEVRRPVP